jgi:hypothetical protein
LDLDFGGLRCELGIPGILRAAGKVYRENSKYGLDLTIVATCSLQNCGRDGNAANVCDD